MTRRSRKPSQPVRQPKFDAGEQSYAFRRSRTITGSATDSVRAASESRAQLQSPRLHEHSLRKHRRKLLGYLFLCLLACGALWYVITSYIGSTITTATMSTQPVKQALDTKRYEALVNAYFADRPFERFSFALNEETFSNYMRAHADEVSDAQLDKGKAFGSAELSLALREPVAAWTIRNQQYFVDSDGNAFTVNYFASPNVVVTDKSGINADAGVVTSTKLLRFIGRVVTIVNASGLPVVQAVELPANSTRQVDFKLKDKNYIIKAHLDRDPAGQAADIINAVTYVQEKNLRPEYLDVRVSSKAFYRNR